MNAAALRPWPVAALRAALLAVLPLAAAAPALAQVPVVRVEGVAILSDALDRAYEARLRARGTSMGSLRNPKVAGEAKREALDELIGAELLWQKARRDGLVVPDTLVDRSVAETVSRFRSRDAFVRRIARDGYDEAGYREYVRRMLSADRAAQAVVDARVRITDADVERYYHDNAAAFSRPERMRLREILITPAPPGGAAERAAAKARAESVRARIAAGEAFADVARQVSDHPTRQWGGEHDPVARGQLAAALDQAVAKLQPGEVSGLIETRSGWHLLKLEERLPAASQPLAEAAGQIRQRLLERRGREAIAEEVAALRAQAQVELLLPQ